MSTLKTFRAVSGSEYVYFKSNETEPSGVSNKVTIKEIPLGSGEITNSQEIISQSLASGSVLLWEWNGENGDQFETLPLTGSISMSINTASQYAPFKNVLRFDMTAGLRQAVWLVKTSSITLPDRFEVEMLVWDSELASGRNAGWTWGDNEHPDGFHGYVFNFFGESNPDIVRYDAGVEVSIGGNTTPGNASMIATGRGGTINTVFESFHPSGSAPSFWMTARGQEGIKGETNDNVEKGQSFEYFEDKLGVVTASWATVTMSQFGINVRGNSLGMNFIEFGAIRIYKHPKDR